MQSSCVNGGQDNGEEPPVQVEGAAYDWADL